MSDWWQAQRLLEEQMFRKVMLEEECEHGIHKDSGHTCMECLMNKGPEDKDER